MAEKITSFSNEKIKNIYHQSREKNNPLFLIESTNLFWEMATNNAEFENILCTQIWYDKHKNKLIKYKLKVIICNQSIIDKIAFIKTPPSVIATYKYHIPRFEISKNNTYIILDNIKDPNNLANIIRSAVAFNFSKIFLSDLSVSPYNDKVIRGSMGSIYQIEINIYKNIKTVIKQLHEIGHQVIASCIDKQATKLHLYKTSQPIAIIFGNETTGLDETVVNLCDAKIFIEINNINSLNLSSAVAIFVFWLSIRETKW